MIQISYHSTWRNEHLVLQFFLHGVGDIDNILTRLAMAILSEVSGIEISYFKEWILGFAILPEVGDTDIFLHGGMDTWLAILPEVSDTDILL